MTELSIYESAVGLCIVCGEDSEGSNYWIGMNANLWSNIRSHITHLFKPNMVQKVLFIPPYDKPLCGAQCSEKYNGKTAR